MLAEILTRLLAEYGTARLQPFAGHELPKFIKSELPNIMKALDPRFGEYEWKSSAGLGQWAKAPWIAALDPTVTDTPQRGFYVVYLFDSQLRSVCLSLNQGVESIRDEFGDEGARERLTHRAVLLRLRAKGLFERTFPETSIALGADTGQSSLAFYERGHAFGKCYPRERIPSDEVLLKDLTELLSIYALLVFRGGVSDTEDLANHLAIGEQGPVSALDERLRKRRHNEIERNPTLAKRAKDVHGHICQACGFDSLKVYGRPYVEAHHLVPLKDLPKDRTAKLSPRDDFAVLCANCHRAIHLPGAPETLDQFVEALKRFQAGQGSIFSR